MQQINKLLGRKAEAFIKMLAKRGRKASYEQPERQGVTVRQG